MGTFVRVTLVVAAAIVVFATLLLVLKLLAVAAIVAVVVIAFGFAIRALQRRRLGARRVIRLTARR